MSKKQKTEKGLLKQSKKGENKRKTGTIKQQRFLKLLSDNLGNSDPKSMYQLMLDAGYTKSVAKQQSGVLNGVHSEVNTIINKLEEKRNKALEYLTDKKLSWTNAANLSLIIDRLTKNVELLSGRPTGREEHILSDEDRDRLDSILSDNEDED